VKNGRSKKAGTEKKNLNGNFAAPLGKI